MDEPTWFRGRDLVVNYHRMEINLKDKESLKSMDGIVANWSTRDFDR